MFVRLQSHLLELLLLLTLCVSVLFRGGKGIESTWMLAGTAIILTLATLFARTNKEGIRSSTPKSEVLRILLYLGILLTIGSYITSETRNYGLDEVIQTVSLGLIFIWCVYSQGVQQHTYLYEKLPKLLTFLLASSTLIGIAVYVLQPVDRFVGTFFDMRFHTDYWPNAWADFLLVCWPPAFFYAWKQSTKKRKNLAFATLCVALSSLYLSYSRGAFIAFLGQITVMGILFGVIVLKDVRYRRVFKATAISTLKVSLLLLTGSILLFFVINQLRAYSYPVQSVQEKVTFSAAEGTSSIDERSQFWQQALELSLRQPLTGFGPYSFRFVQPPLMQGVLATSDHAHNVFLKFAMERGIPFAVLFAIGILLLFYACLVPFFTKRKAMSFEKDAWTIVCVGALTGLLAHQLIDYNLQFVGVSLPAVLLGAVLLRASSVQTVQVPTTLKREQLYRALDVVCAIGLFILCLYEGIFLVTSSMGRHAAAAGNTEAALTWFNRSSGQLFSRDLHLSTALLQLEEGNVERAEHALQTYTARNPHDPRTQKIRGELLLEVNDYRTAAVALEQAFLQARFTDLSISRLYLQALLSAGNTEVIERRENDFNTVFTAFAEAIEQNAHFIALSENVEELERMALLLTESYPESTISYQEIAMSALTHALVERSRLAARPPGRLW